MTCPECGVKMERSTLTSNVFLIHSPANSKEVLRSLRCPLFGASVSIEIPATLAPEQKDRMKERVLQNVVLRRWYRQWFIDFHDWVDPW